MKRRLLITALSFGTIFGFASGFVSLGSHWHGHHERRRAAFEDHIADVCVDAARRAEDREAAYDDYDRPPSDYPEWDEPRERSRHHRHDRHDRSQRRW